MLVTLVLSATGCTAADVATPTPPPATSAPPASTLPPTLEPSPSELPPEQPPDPGAGDTLVLRAPRDGSLLVRGTYPRIDSSCRRFRQPVLEARYPGRLEVVRTDDGTMRLTVTLDFERYLEGIAEVPPSWPAAALEAQAIAARSYALAHTGWNGEQGQTLETPICATDACQVYRGMPVEPVPDIDRWYAAVRRTAGQVLTASGRPIEAVYFSTSNGRIYGNDEIFGSAPLPYLRPGVERDDGASPTSRWRVRLPYDDLARFLAAAGEWPDGVTIANARPRGGDIVVEGGGQTRTMSVSALRAAVNGWAPCLMPGRYPGASPSGGTLPLTVPSGWFTASHGTEALVLDGRGWGHGVGMVQWGAYGKARTGWSAARILSHYYGGLEPMRGTTPGLIHVLVAEGLRSVRAVPSGAGARLDGRALGDGGVVIVGGSRLSIAPDG